MPDAVPIEQIIFKGKNNQTQWCKPVAEQFV